MTKTLRILALCTAAAAALNLAACKGSDEDKPANHELVGDGSFEISITGITTRTAEVDVVYSADGRFYFDVLEEEYYLEYKNELGFQQFIDNAVRNAMEYTQGDKEQALNAILSTAADGYSFSSLDPDTSYYAFAMGVDDEGKLTTSVTSKAFRTLSVPPSNNTFEITVDNETYDGADYRVVPSIKGDSYFVDIWNKKLVDGMSEKEFIEYCYEHYQSLGGIDMMCVSGDFTCPNEGICQPDREYYVVVFGCNDGVATTPITKKAFSTLSGGDPKECTFTFGVDNIVYNRAECSVTPSDPYNVFVWDAVDVEYLNAKMAETGKTQQEAMTDILAEYIGIFREDFGTLQETVEMISLYGAYTSNGTDTNSLRLSPDKEYMVWAVCVDEDGNAVAPFRFGEPFRTPADIVSTATATVSVDKYFDAATLNNPAYPSWYAVVPIKVTVSDDAAHWYVDLFASDISGASRDDIIRNLRNMGAMDTTPHIMLAVWDEVCTAAAIAVDADGNFGKPDFFVHAYDKSGASPASEFDEYTTATSAAKAEVLNIAPRKAAALVPAKQYAPAQRTTARK